MLDIIYEDKYILAVHKPAGIATQTAHLAQSDVVSMVKKYLRNKAGKTAYDPYLGLIGRLDQPVEGIVLMGLDPDVTGALNSRLAGGSMTKRYTAACVSRSAPVEGVTVTLTDRLLHDKKENVSRITEQDDKNGKDARLNYEIRKCTSLPETDSVFLNLADIELITGRHHQIRVQMAGAGLPLLGDRKYAPEYVQNVSKLLKVSQTALCACELCFTHPVTNDIINLRVEPQGKWYSFF